ncbi:TetR family transcriptional regulator [Amycolatopsis sp. NPDC005232]|uniref:TetR family transcriptional regulator n=1 Tax=Amycolatopsis sp. NPDC005232 TaxID=3157027 RepID=UPI0033B6E547
MLQVPEESGRDVRLNSAATPVLNEEVLQAQSAQIDTISASTYTSRPLLDRPFHNRYGRFVARTREFDTDAAIETAMSAFRRAGYAGTSIQDLVDATGVGRGSLYAAFGSKEGLYLAVLDRYRERYAEPIVGLLKEGVNTKAVIREVLVGVVDATVEDGSREACLVVGAATELAHRDLAVRDRLQGTIQSLEDALFELIVRGQAAGELPADRSAATTARLLVTTIQGLRVVGAIRPDRATLMATVDLALTCFC